MSKNIRILIILCTIFGFLLLIPKPMIVMFGMTGHTSIYFEHCIGFSFETGFSEQVPDGGGVRYCIGIPYK